VVGKKDFFFVAVEEGYYYFEVDEGYYRIKSDLGLLAFPDEIVSDYRLFITGGSKVPVVVKDDGMIGLKGDKLTAVPAS
jgi:hypothetical protein